MPLCFSCRQQPLFAHRTLSCQSKLPTIATPLQRSRKLALRNLHLGVDVLVLFAAMGLAFAVQTALRPLIPALKAPPPFHVYAGLISLALPVWLALIAILGLHKSFERPWSSAALMVELIKLHVLGLVGVALIGFLTQSTINRSLVGLFLICSGLLMFVLRSAIGAWVGLLHRRGHGQDQVLLIGTPSAQMATFLRLAKADSLPPHILGYLGDSLSSEAEWSHVIPKRVGALSDLGSVLHDLAADHVIFFDPFSRPESVPAALESCEEVGVGASFSIDLTRRATATPHIIHLYEQPFVSFEVAPKSHAALSIKHALDALVAGLGILLIAPILLLTSLAIAITMGRPIFFSQTRAGLHGRRFRMLKFRTMVRDAEAKRKELESKNEMGGPVFKLTADPRITRLGHFLRKYSIDELPQLFNVLAGTMSLIGPRPLPLVEQEQIRGWQRRRLSMRPGITGLWQVSGRSDISFEEWMVLDLRYIDEWSLSFDLRILLKTVPVVLFGAAPDNSK